MAQCLPHPVTLSCRLVFFGDFNHFALPAARRRLFWLSVRLDGFCNGNQGFDFGYRVGDTYRSADARQDLRIRLKIVTLFAVANPPSGIVNVFDGGDFGLCLSKHGVVRGAVLGFTDRLVKCFNCQVDAGGKLFF